MSTIPVTMSVFNSAIFISKFLFFFMFGHLNNPRTQNILLQSVVSKCLSILRSSSRTNCIIIILCIVLKSREYYTDSASRFTN